MTNYIGISFGKYEVLPSRVRASVQPQVEGCPVSGIETRHKSGILFFEFRFPSYASFLSLISNMDPFPSPWLCKAGLLWYARLRALYNHFES